MGRFCADPNLAEKIEALRKKRGAYAAHLAALEKSGEDQISLTASRSGVKRRENVEAGPRTPASGAGKRGPPAAT